MLGINLIEKYKDLEFEELTHTYKWKEKIKGSATGYLKQFCNPFDVGSAAIRVALREEVDVLEIKNRWRLDNFFGISKGNMVHFYSEDWALGKKTDPLNEWQAGIIQFWINLPKHYVLIHAELQMYSYMLDICGTCDAILFNTLTGKFVLVDYKTNKDLFTSFGTLKLFPYTIPDNNYNKYGLQLSIYEIMLNEIGIEVEDRWLIWANRCNNQLYQKYSAPNFKTDIIEHAVNKRSNRKNRIPVQQGYQIR